MRYWINTISLEHVERGVAGGFTQADHGRDARLKRLERGDWIAFYSPRTAMRGGEPVKAFTAIRWIGDEAPFQVEVSPDFHPLWRRVDFQPCHASPVRPSSSRCRSSATSSAGATPFRRGLFEVPADDFATIASAMGVDLR